LENLKRRSNSSRSSRVVAAAATNTAVTFYQQQNYNLLKEVAAIKAQVQGLASDLGRIERDLQKESCYVDDHITSHYPP
jgi:hypothetical protein